MESAACASTCSMPVLMAAPRPWFTPWSTTVTSMPYGRAATAANSVIKEWQAKGGKVLAQSKTVPIKHVIVGASISPDQVLALREYFTTLDASEEGRKKLEPSKLRGFATHDEAAMLELGQWLGL